MCDECYGGGGEGDEEEEEEDPGVDAAGWGGMKFHRGLW